MLMFQLVRPVDDYIERIADIEYKGGRYVFSNAVNMIKQNKELKKKDVNSQIIIITITGNNIAHTQVSPTRISNLAICFHIFSMIWMLPSNVLPVISYHIIISSFIG